MANPAFYDFSVYQGDVCEVLFRVREYTWNGTAWVPGAYIPLTGKTPQAHVKVKKSDETPFLIFDCVLGDQTASPGTVFIKLTPTQTAKMTEKKYVYDVQLVGGPDDVVTYLSGNISVTGEVTRNA